MEEKRPAYRVEMKEIIGSYHLSAVLTDEEAITDAWNNLYGRLEELHGKPLRTYHERPFRLEQDGQSIVGSIDLVWQTAEGNIVVDYKTNPMGPKAVLDPEMNTLWAGMLVSWRLIRLPWRLPEKSHQTLHLLSCQRIIGGTG